MERKNWIKRTGFTILTAVGFLLLSSCCCDDVLEKLTKQYDYIKNWKCKSGSKGSGCVTYKPTNGEAEAHVEIESEHEASVESACKYKKNTAVQTAVGFQRPEGSSLYALDVNMTFNEKAITFNPDDYSAEELSGLYGGEWHAFQMAEAVTPTTSDKYMDSMSFSYALSYTYPLPGPGIPMPETVNYNMAMIDPDTGDWEISPTTSNVEYPPVIVSVVVENAENLPLRCNLGDAMTLYQVHVKNTGQGLPAGSTLEASVITKGEEVHREVLAEVDRMAPWGLQTFKQVVVNIPTNRVGEFSFNVEVRDEKGERIGNKQLGLRISPDSEALKRTRDRLNKTN